MLAQAAPVEANGVPDVSVTPLPNPTIQEFDPSSPPADLPPGEDAQAKTSVEIVAGGFDIGFDNATKKFVVTGGDPITVTGKTIIRQPNNASDKLKQHELGHHELAKDEYARAKRKVEDAFRGFIGMQFCGTGADLDAQAKDANTQIQKEIDDRIARATKAIEQQIQTLNDKYDTLTDHSKSSTVDTDDGITEAKKERDKAPAAGEQGNAMDGAQPLAMVNASTVLTYDFTEQAVQIADALIDSAGSPFDPIIGRGSVQIDPLFLIGPQLNGTIHLSDTVVNIVDVPTGTPLMHAFLYEVAYMPSSLPGFAGMISGHLDVPPVFAAGGVTNTIGSGFLNGIQEASAGLRETVYRFHTDDPVFDADGNILLDGRGTTGQAEMGVATPEPSSLALFGLGLLGLGGVRRKRRA